MSDEQALAELQESRVSDFKVRAESRICLEEAMEANPYIAERRLWHGYDAFELMRKRDFVDVIFLLLKGDLPTPQQKCLFEQILVALANPGPRHPATRAVMNAAASKTNTVNLLPIGLSLMAGRHSGALEVDAAMRFLARNISKQPEMVAQSLFKASSAGHESQSSAPGFGEHFGGKDPIAEKIACHFANEFELCESVRWGLAMLEHVDSDTVGWFMTGVAAAVFLDLGFRPALGATIVQFAASPGLLAHGAEMSNRPVTAMPFVADQEYFYTGPSRE